MAVFFQGVLLSKAGKWDHRHSKAESTRMILQRQKWEDNSKQTHYFQSCSVLQVSRTCPPPLAQLALLLCYRLKAVWMTQVRWGTHQRSGFPSQASVASQARVHLSKFRYNFQSHFFLFLVLDHFLKGMELFLFQLLLLFMCCPLSLLFLLFLDSYVPSKFFHFLLLQRERKIQANTSHLGRKASQGKRFSKHSCVLV